MTSTSRILASLMALQALLAWALPSGVLCLARDGHVELEAFASDCTQHEEHEAEALVGPPAAAELEGCCGPCLDIPVLQAPASLEGGGGQALPSPSLAGAWPLPGFSPPADPGERRLSPAPLPPRPALAALRTIVLTC